MLTIRRFLILFTGLLILFVFRTRVYAEQQMGHEALRHVDAVVLTGASLPDEIIGADPDQMAFVAVRDGVLLPIPFQVDARDENGRFLFPEDRAGRKRPVGINRSDEIVFMAFDLGEVYNGDFEVAKNVMEIVVNDPITEGNGYAYLLTGMENPPRSDADYADYDSAKNEVDALDYVCGYDPKAPISISKLLVKKEAGGSGKSIADRMKIRVRGKVLFGLVEIHRNEEGFFVKQTGLKDGPVRVIRRTKSWQHLFWRIPTPSVEVDTYYYGTKMVFPIDMTMPFDMNAFFKDPYLRLSTDSVCSRPGRKYYNSNNPGGVDIDGVMSPEEENLDDRQYSWSLVAGTTPGEEGGLMSRFIFNVEEFPIGYHLFYRDDMQTVDPPENEPGYCGTIGYEFEGIPYIKKGVLKMTTYMYPVPGIYSPGDEVSILNDLDHPLHVEIKMLR